MASKKGICPYCNLKAPLESRVFPVNAEAATCFCPYCMHELQPKKAIENYNNLIEKMILKADRTLFVVCDPALAYREYANVLEVEENNYRALLGRILCLIYTSKVRKEYLSDANELLENIAHKGAEQTSNYVSALKKINFALDEYNFALLKRLNYKEHFYDEDCLILYLTHLYDILEFKKDILKRLKYIDKNYTTQNNTALIEELDAIIKQKEESLKEDKFTIDGVGYNFVKIAKGKAVIEKNNEVSYAKFNKFHAYTLKEGVKGKKYIKDQVFKDYTPIVRLKNLSLALIIVLLAGAASSGICSFACKENSTVFILCLVMAGIGALAAIALFVFHLIWRNVLKKRKMRID